MMNWPEMITCTSRNSGCPYEVSGSAPWATMNTYVSYSSIFGRLVGPQTGMTARVLARETTPSTP